MVSRVAFTVLVALVAVQRLAELRRSARHEALLRARGAREHAPGQMRWMRVVHAAWLVGMLVEAWALERVAPPGLVVVAAIVLVAGQALRLAAIRELGPRWTVRILTLPGEPPVQGGVFAHLRHPNYLGVILEIAALPLLGGAWGTALVASLANGLLLRARIRAEEDALGQAGGYGPMRARPRFVPGMRD